MMNRKQLMLLLGALALGACTNAIGGGKGENGSPPLTYQQAVACIAIATDPDMPTSGSYDVKRLTNTCEPDLNVAYCVSDGRDPVCPAVEQPGLSHNEWTRAYVTQGSAGVVSVGACQSPQMVRTEDEGNWYCE